MNLRNVRAWGAAVAVGTAVLALAGTAAYAGHGRQAGADAHARRSPSPTRTTASPTPKVSPTKSPSKTPSKSPSKSPTTPPTPSPTATTPSGEPTPGTPTTDLVRRDGRVDQFAIVSLPGVIPQQALRVWYRPQTAPGGPYGAWTMLSDLGVNVRWPFVTPIENTDGRLEAFFDVAYAGPTYRLFQTSPGGPWSGEVFSLPSPTWWGGPALAQLPDGRWGYAQTTAHVSGHEVGMWYVAQTSPSGPWGTWEYLGTGPFYAPVTYPQVNVTPSDGTFHIAATMWTAVNCKAHIDQLPTGGWSAWWIDPSSPADCPLPRP